MAVYRMIDGCLFEGTKSDEITVRAYDCGNGHLEVSGYRKTIWAEKGIHADVIESMRDIFEEHAASDATIAEKAEACAAKSAQRAKKRVRQLCKVIGSDTLLTLTYRANQTDMQLCKKHLKEFVRRVKRVIPTFRAVCGFEQQQRGAWHVHMATTRLMPIYGHSGQQWRSYDLLRHIWRSVTQELGGNIDVSARKRNSKRSPAAIAAYISKYITKDYAEGEKWTNRWTRFGEMELPKPIDLGVWTDMRTCIAECFDLLTDGHTVANMRVNKWGDAFFLWFEKDKPSKPVKNPA